MSYLSKRGYVVKKESLSKEELAKLKLELKARPLTDDKFNFNKGDNSYPVYIETKTKMYIPKMFGIEKYGIPPTILDNYNGKDWENPIEFKGSLLERQIEPVEELLKACNEKGGGILTLSTGFGKTFCGLYALSKLKSKAIIIVNKIPLMNQWKSEIETFLPNAKIGTIQGKKNVDIVDCDIVIAMLQSLARIDYPDELFNDFKVVIVDEVHNTPSEHFSKVLFKVCCKYTIGLSATPKRADGCEYVFKWHLGEIVFKDNVQRVGLAPIIKLLKIDTTEYKEISTENRFTGAKTIQFTSMLSELVEMPKRNLLIVELIKNVMKDPSRKILVLSDRRTHLQNLKGILDADLSVTFTYGLFLGSMKQADLEVSRASNVILATFAAFSEGVSEKNLNCLITISPKKYIHLKTSVKQDSGKLKQVVGRIFRKNHTEQNPIIIDLSDNFSVYKSQGNSRKIFYKEEFKNGIFEDLSINLDDHEDVKIEYIKTKTKKTTTIKEVESAFNTCLIDN